MNKIIAIITIFISINAFSQENYWQQKARYKMEIDVNESTDKYLGNQTIVYYNNSPAVLEKVYFHMYWNAFQPGSAMDFRLQNIVDPDRRMTIKVGDSTLSKISILKSNEIGYQKILSLKQNGKNVKFSQEGTILTVVLNKKMRANSKTSFQMKWEAQIPKMIRRAGRNNAGNVKYSMAQWYPKLCEYDSDGWHNDEYISREFQGVFADFDVKINIQKDFVIDGSGTLESKKNINNNKKSWRFIAKNIHDFAWVADKDFIIDKVSKKGIPDMYFTYKKNQKNIDNWKKIQPFTQKLFEYLNNKIGQYPYPKYSIVQGGDGGMEYGQCTFVKSKDSFESFAGTVFHEASHSWFQHVLATNETKYAWMDEGFTSFVEAEAYNEIFAKNKMNPHMGSYRNYAYLVNSGKEEPLTTMSDYFTTNMNYGIASYSKGEVFLSQLEYIVGENNFDKILKEYYKTWKLKHSTPSDLREISQKISGINLKWYFNSFIGTTKFIDYSIKYSDKKISIEKLGELHMPLDILVQYKDGEKELFYIPIRSMRGSKIFGKMYENTTKTKLKNWVWTMPNYSFETKKEVSKIVIDPTLRLADINLENNIFEIK